MSPVATDPVLIKTEIPSFFLHQGLSTSNNLLRMNEIDPLSHFKGLQMGIFGFWQKETGAKSAVLTMTQRVLSCFFCDVHSWCQVWKTLLKFF